MAQAALPALGIASSFAPNSQARLTATPSPRALKEAVTFSPSSLI